MKNIQFVFSLLVAIALNVLGVVILQQDSAGFGLIIVGSALLLIAITTKNTMVNNNVVILEEP